MDDLLTDLNPNIELLGSSYKLLNYTLMSKNIPKETVSSIITTEVLLVSALSDDSLTL